MPARPASVNIRNQAVGATSAAATITFTNTSNVRVTVTSASIVGANRGDFIQRNTGVGVIAARKTCTATVLFATPPGGTHSASMLLNNNASIVSQPVTLNGTGF